MRRASLIVVGSLFLLATVADAQVRPRNGSILDQTATISGKDKNAINRICQQVRDRTNGEILVAVLPTTNGQNPRRFATNLFNRWKIGDAFSNQGILILVAINDRKAEIILGDGLDGSVGESKARTVMSDYMMPEFKRGNPSKGILIAVQQCADRFFANSQASSNAPDSESNAAKPTSNSNRSYAGRSGFAISTDKNKTAEAEAGNNADDFEFVADAQAAADTHGVDVPVPVAAAHNIDRPRPLNRQNGGRGVRAWLAMLLGGGATAGGVGLGYRLLTARRKPRDCEHCQQPMVLLNETDDDAHLQPAERVEEQLGSVDYDVWSCSGCDHVIKIRYGAFFTRYGKCPSCRAKTKSSTTRTISRATTFSTGLKEVEEVCQNCDHHHITQHVIPMVVESSSSSSGFSSGGGSSFSSGGGGGFSGGGGSSSGGGASGSW